MLTQLTYSSRSTRNLSSKELSLIVSSSHRNNVLHGLTGALCYANGTFLQYFEGEHLAVKLLYQYLQEDERHSCLEIVSVNEITARRFPTWSMGVFSYENDIAQLFLKHSRMAEFNPFSMSPSDVNEFFDEVVKYVAVP